MLGDLFGPSTTKLFECLREEQTQRSALMLALLKKGVIATEEYDVALAQARAALDQKVAEARDEYARAHPEEAKTAAFFEKLLSGGPLSHGVE